MPPVRQRVAQSLAQSEGRSTPDAPAPASEPSPSILPKGHACCAATSGSRHCSPVPVEAGSAVLPLQSRAPSQRYTPPDERGDVVALPKAPQADGLRTTTHAATHPDAHSVQRIKLLKASNLFVLQRNMCICMKERVWGRVFSPSRLHSSDTTRLR